MKKRVACLFGILFISSSAHSGAGDLTLKESILAGTAMGAICTNMARQLGADSKIFEEIITESLEAGKRIGIISDLDEYMKKSRLVSAALESQLMDDYGTKENVYNNWCSRVQKGYADRMDELGMGK